MVKMQNEMWRFIKRLLNCLLSPFFMKVKNENPSEYMPALKKTTFYPKKRIALIGAIMSLSVTKMAMAVARAYTKAIAKAIY